VRAWHTSFRLPGAAAVTLALLLITASARADTAVDGAALYQKHCAPCHGATAKGDGPIAATFTAPPRNLRDGFLDLYSTEDLVRRVLAGRALQLAVDPKALRARAQDTEALVAHLQRLGASDWEKVSRGWGLYAQRCEGCHDPYGHPAKPLPPGVHTPRDLSDEKLQKETSDAAMARAVRHGRSGMPALVPRISEEEAKGLAAYVRLLSPGFELYSRYCTSCHGDDGRGDGKLGEELGQPTVMLDRNYMSKQEPEELRIKVWHMVGNEKPSMPHYRWTIREAQARQIVDFLKSLD